MPKPDTKSAALSRLFGNKPGTDGVGERPEEDQVVQEKEREATPKREKKKSSTTLGRARGTEPAKESQEKTSTPSAKETPVPKRHQKPKQTTGEADSSPAKERLNQKSSSQGPPAPPEPSEEEQTGGSGYIGSGRYRRTTGVLERISPYIRPDQAEALRVAVALRSDPRGSDITSIIQSLLDEAGYHGEDS